MKYLIVLTLCLLTSLPVIGQPDTLFLTLEQEKTLESILDSFQQRQMDVDQIYMDNKRFKSLMGSIDKMDDSKNFSFVVRDSLYQIAEKIYPKNRRVSHWKNPHGCFFEYDIIERTQSRLTDYSNFSRRLRGENEFNLTNDQFNQVYVRQMEEYLSTLKHSLDFIDMNLEGRLWVHLYFAELEKAHIVILSDRK